MRIAAIGAVASAGGAFGSALLVPTESVVGMLACGVASAAFAAKVAIDLLSPSRESDGDGLLWFGNLFIATAAIIFGMTIEEPLVGQVATNVAPRDASRVEIAVAYSFRGAHVRVEDEASTDIRGRYGPVDTAYVAPVVASDQNDEPIAVWAVAKSDSIAEARRAWRSSAHAGIRVGGLDAADYRRAIESSVAAGGFSTRDNPLLVRWVDRVDDEPKSAWLALGRIVGVAAIAHAVLAIAVAGWRGVGGRERKGRR